MRDWCSNRTVTLRLQIQETCDFDRKEKRKLDPKGKYQSEGFGRIWETKVVHKIDEWFWKFSYNFELSVFSGQYDDASKIVLQSRGAKYEIVTTTEESPRPEKDFREPIDVNLTWLLQRINDQGEVNFVIDRGLDSCRTPRRNDNVQEALLFYAQLFQFAQRSENYFRQELFPIYRNGDLDLASANARGILVPAVPLFDASRTVATAASASLSKKMLPLALSKGIGNVKAMASAGDLSGMSISKAASVVQQEGLTKLPVSVLDSKPPLMAGSDLLIMLKEHSNSLTHRILDLKFPQESSQRLISALEGRMAILGGHLQQIAQHFQDAVDFIEDMLRNQLIAALGKIVTPPDFDLYMRYHNRQLFQAAFQPRKFCYAIRRPNHFPEGILSLEQQLPSGHMEEVETTVQVSPFGSPMKFAISSATEVHFTGTTYLHGYLGHKFSNSQALPMSLNARARQFSSFILMVGRIIGPNQFDPKYGIILKDKDDLKIPLDFETIPSAKEFKESISSISETQQRFAKAFRSMQLESTLFGVCIVQIKPQLERLLGLPVDGLTKEIRMSQDILELLMRYQIPADLISFDGDDSVGPRARVAVVKNYVSAMQAMIQKFKTATIQETVSAAIVNEQVPLSFVDYDEMVEVEEEGGALSDDEDDDAGFAFGGGGGGGGGLTLMSASMPVARAAPAPLARRQGRRADEGAVSSSSASAAPPPAAQPAAPAVIVAQEKKPEAQAPAKTDPMNASLEVQVGGAVGSAARDFTQIPKRLDAKFEEIDENGAVRPAIINVSDRWSKRYQQALLAPYQVTDLDLDSQLLEREQCFDLLDALSKSGGLPFEGVDLHCIVGFNHCFDKTVIDTLVQDNVNPIERVEQSQLIIASTLFEKSVAEMVKPSSLASVIEFNPKLFL